MATYFTRGVESVNELRISLSRINAFLTLPEPPVPSHLKVRHWACTAALPHLCWILMDMRTHLSCCNQDPTGGHNGNLSVAEDGTASCRMAEPVRIMCFAHALHAHIVGPDHGLRCL